MQCLQEASFDVFISYSSYDEGWVETLAQNLKAEGYGVFFAKWAIPAGRRIADVLDNALSNCKKSILVVTPQSQDSEWVKTEYRKMLERQQEKDSEFIFVPVILAGEACLPSLRRTLQVDFRNPDKYRDAFHRLICGLEGKEPGEGPPDDWAPNLDIPARRTDICGAEEGITAFVDNLFEKLIYQAPPVALLAQAGRHHEFVDRAILRRAEATWGKTRARWIILPYGSDADTGELFRFLGEQCELPAGAVSSTLSFQTAFSGELKKNPLFLMVTGIENTSEKSRKEVAGVLRNLSEKRNRIFKLVISGGEKLADLKYAIGDLSLLSNADEVRYPELTAADLLGMAADMGMIDGFKEEKADEILTLTGGHPGLVLEALRLMQKEPDVSLNSMKEALAQSGAMWQLFTPYLKDPIKKQTVQAYLEKEDLGPYRPFIFDRTLSDLYWKNLLTVCLPRDKKQFVWRSALIRQMGKEILGCDT